MKERIVFIGRNTRYTITQACFRALVDFPKTTDHSIVAVVVSEDKPEKSEPSLSSLAKSAGLKVLQPQGNDVNEKKFIKRIQAFEPTLMLTVQFPKIYKPEFFSIPTKACLNVHRGWPLRGGSIDLRTIFEEHTTYSLILHHIDEGIDTGNIIGLEQFPVAKKETGYSLDNKVTEYGVKLLKNRLFPNLGETIPPGWEQDISKTKYGNKWDDKRKQLDFERYNADEIERLSRALFHPREKGLCWTTKDKNFFLKPVEIGRDLSSTEQPGQVITAEEDKIIMAAKDKEIIIKNPPEGLVQALLSE